MLRSAARRIAINNGRRIAAAPGPVIAGISPELAALHALASRIEDGAACLVGKQFRRGFQELEQARLQRSQQRRRTADPIGERGAVEIDALAAIDLRLPIQRTVISVFADKHVGDKVFGWDAGFDHTRWRRSLHDRVFAGPAGIFRPARDDDFELGRRHVEPLGAVLAHDMHGAATARASRALRLDNDFFPRQMGRQFAAIDRAGLLGRRFQRRVRGLLCGPRFSDRLLGLLHGEAQLIGIELFGFTAELRAPQLA